MFAFETSEQNDIRSQVRKMAERELPKYRGDQWLGTLPRPLFTSCAELGLAGLAIAEEHGGLAATAVTSLIATEELAAVDLGPAIFVSVHTMVSGIIGRLGNHEQKARLLPRLASGEMLGAFALTEPSAGSDAAALRTSAIRAGESFVLNGEKCYITSAGYADLYIVFARTGSSTERDEISAFIVEKDTPGLSISPPEKKMGCELSPIASLTFTNATIPASNLLGELHRGYQGALAGLAGGRISIAACANGLSRTAITLSTKHLLERSQFGKKLAELQGLQFMLADMQMKLEASQLLTWQAARELDATPSSRQNRINSSMAKCFATDAAMQITTDAVQLLGGAGYIKEYMVERLMRDAKMLQIVEGTNQVQRMLIARELFARS